MIQSTRRHPAALCAAAIVLLLGAQVFVSPAIAGSSPATTPATGATFVQPAKLSDPALLGLVGKWDGTCKMGNQAGAGPAEMMFTTGLSGQWLEATIHAWSDAAKKSMFFDARMYIRPTETPGTYKTYAVDNSGVGQTGRILVKDGVWQWNFDYDNGNKEVGSMDDPANGKVVYKGTVTDPSGQEVMYVGFNLTKTKTPYSTK